MSKLLTTRDIVNGWIREPHDARISQASLARYCDVSRQRINQLLNPEMDKVRKARHRARMRGEKSFGAQIRTSDREPTGN